MASYHCTLNKRYTEQLKILTARWCVDRDILNECAEQLLMTTRGADRSWPVVIFFNS